VEDIDPLVIIPARYASTRYPGKPLAKLKGAGGVERPLIEWTWQAAVGAMGAAHVVVATDDNRIADEVRRFGGQVMLTPSDLRNGTERCAWVIQSLSVEPQLVVNFQGDAPLIPPALVRELVGFARSRNSQMATPYVLCNDTMAEMLRAVSRDGRAGGTCVVTNARSQALYFSKYPIPFGDGVRLKMHIGLYAYAPAALRQYLRLPPSDAEISEGLEQLRFLDAGVDIDMLELNQMDGQLWELNNPEDISIVERELATHRR
jgi:3-deoxy-manno-octulosonate cytidylyltransferase (CMP-KDO synthetase)